MARKSSRKRVLHLSCGFLLLAGLCAAGESTTSTQSLITSWNVCAKQFIDAPTFTLLPVPGTVLYRATASQGAKSWTVSSRTPEVSLGKIWRRLAVKNFTLKLEWVDKAGQILHTETGTRTKAPDFHGFKEPAANWVAAAHRNVAYLIDADKNNHINKREPGVPLWVQSVTPKCNNSYPCIILNNMIWAFLGHVENGGPQSEEALRQARACADWALAHGMPEDWKLPRFPYSYTNGGKVSEQTEVYGTNLMRASWLAISFVDLYQKTRHQPYLDYARHIADTTVAFQNADGSFPYRVNPKTGAIVEQYNCNVMEFVELVDKLEPLGFDARRAMAARRALEWVLAYPCVTNNWKAAYEDVGETRFYSNLSQMGILRLIVYLCRHQGEDPDYLPMARRLNRWVEDQFVAFGPDDEASPVRVKGPLVFEQYICWAPMEGHTANWILSLIELHKATGERQYLDKAKAAANAICHDQFPNAEFSTWGRDGQTGQSVTLTDPAMENWYNGNAFADWALYDLTLYVKSLDGGK